MFIISDRSIRANTLLLASAASLALCAPAFAQTNDTIESTQTARSADRAETEVGEIIVTAQKRAQNVQDVPISMSVFNSNQLFEKGVQDLSQLDRYVPNFWVQAPPGNNAYYIRGIGSQPGNLAFEQTVGLFVDGIYAGHARQFQAPFLDIERVEILRGPQGALVGKNTSAGAISVITARPTSELFAQAEGAYEFELDSYRLFGVVSGPIANGIMVRVAGQYEHTGGYIENTVLGGKEPQGESLFGRASVLFDNGGPVNMLIKVEGGSMDLTGTAAERILTVDDPNLERATGGFPNFVGKDWDNTNNFNASATINIDIGEHTLTSLSGYSSYDFEKRLDSDFGPLPLFGSGFAENFDQLSEELRIASPTGMALEYIAGIYFSSSDYDLYSSTLINLGPFLGRSDRVFRQQNTVWSGFGSATYHLGEAVRLIGSLRYTADDKSADQQRMNTGTVLPSWLTTPLNGEINDTGWDPAATIQWDATSGAMLYATYGQGSKAGGFVGAQSATTQATFEVLPESSETFEIGAKLALFDRRLRFNLAIFRTDFSNLQVSSYDATTTAFITTNAGQARSQGFESDFSFRVSKALSFNGTFAHLDAKYIDFPGAPCYYTNPTCNPATNNAAGQPLPRSPEWSGTLFADVLVPINDKLEFTANGGITYQSFAYLEESYNPAGGQEAFTKLDLRAGVRTTDGRWELALIGKNLTDVITANHAFGTPLAPNIISQFIQPPRTIALQARFNY